MENQKYAGIVNEQSTIKPQNPSIVNQQETIKTRSKDKAMILLCFLAFRALFRSVNQQSLRLVLMPRRLRVTPADPWPGDPARGADILAGRYHLCGRIITIDSDPFIPDLPQPTAVLIALHGFGWLHDLRSQGGDQARKRARTLCSQWLDHYERWAEPGWDAVATGLRLRHWLLLHDFFLENADHSFRERLYRAMMRRPDI